MTTTRARTRVHCTEHGQTSPCTSCAADHVLGAHTRDNRQENTCGRCTPPRPLRPPTADWPALAANDHLEEADDA